MAKMANTMAEGYKEIRLCILSNNSVVGCFRILSSNDQRCSSGEFDDDPAGHIVLHLSPSGGCYTFLDAYGKMTQHLTRFFPAHLRKPLRRIVDFRNAHVEGDPYICEELFTVAEQITVASRLKSFRFSFARIKSRTSGIESLDGFAKVQLCGEGNYARVKYLSPISCRLDDFRYAWVTRWVHLPSHSRQCKFYPVLCLLKALNSRLKRGGVEAAKSAKDIENDHFMRYLATEIPRCPPDAHEVNFEGSQDIYAFAANPLQAVCASAAIRLEWTEACTYRTVLSPSKQLVNVVASITKDRSTLEFEDVENGTLLHKRGKSRQLYVQEGIPRAIRQGLEEGEEYNFEEIARKCSILIKERHKFHAEDRSQKPFHKALAQKASAFDQGKDSAGIPNKLYIVRVEKVRNLGQFTALSDRSIKAVFDDRTVLHSNPGFTRCRLIFADGSSVHVNVSLPLHAKRYVHAANSFYEWVFDHSQSIARKTRRGHVRRLVEATNKQTTTYRKQVGLLLNRQLEVS